MRFSISNVTCFLLSVSELQMVMTVSDHMAGLIYISIMPDSSFEHDFLFFYMGIAFLAMFYWLIMLIYSKRRNYLVLIVSAAGCITYYLNSFGLIIPSRPNDPVLLAVFTFTSCVLASELNQFKKNLSNFTFKLFFIITVASFILQCISPLFFSWQTAVAISLGLIMVCIITVSSLFIHLWLVKHQYTAGFSLFAYSPGMMGVIFFAFSQMKIFPPEYKISGPVGAVISILLLYYGMVTYIIALRKKRENEHREKEELIRQQNILLEHKVIERTRELEIEKRRSEALLIKASKKQMAELELQSLRAQLNPHFMFNSLNAIQDLILKEDFESSHVYLSRFARLLRMLVENIDKPFASLQKEIEFLELYLLLEKLRLPDLQFVISIDPAINKEKTYIPNMILQPYIENALLHGLSHKTVDRKLELNIRKKGVFVVYEVKDNGVGRKKAAELNGVYRKEHRSRGMDLLAKRFELLGNEFGSTIQSEVCDIIKNGEVQGTRVSITVPDWLTSNIKKDLYDSHNYYRRRAFRS